MHYCLHHVVGLSLTPDFGRLVAPLLCVYRPSPQQHTEKEGHRYMFTFGPAILYNYINGHRYIFTFGPAILYNYINEIH
jgi:hypothetical protein